LVKVPFLNDSDFLILLLNEKAVTISGSLCSGLRLNLGSDPWRARQKKILPGRKATPSICAIFTFENILMEKKLEKHTFNAKKILFLQRLLLNLEGKCFVSVFTYFFETGREKTGIVRKDFMWDIRCIIQYQYKSSFDFS